MKQNRTDSESRPNRTSGVEQAEESPDSMRGNETRRSRARSNREGGSDRGHAGGITNRGLDREQSEQDQVPGRGRSQAER